MKKFVLTGLAILLALSLSTCEIAPVAVDGGSGFTDVVYSADGKSLTLYLDGTVVPQTQASRALTPDLAKMGHDYYEVVFFYRPNGGTGATDRIARVSWEIGQPVGIKEVYRTATGVDYGSITAITNSPVSDIFSAILFVGRKADKTLLAVGKLVDARGPGGLNAGGTNAVSTLVNTETRSVTFQVAALESGVNLNCSDFDSSPSPSHGLGWNVSNSDFWTNALTALVEEDPPTTNNDYEVSFGNTDVKPIRIGGVDFPVYELRSIESSLLPTTENMTLSATYTIDTVDTFTAGGYLNGIIISAAGTITKREPRFPVGGGSYAYADFTIDQNTAVAMTNNQVAAVGSAFNPEISFTFNIANTIKSMFALTFDIPVYAITNASPSSEGTEAETWFIRPGYGTYRYDLDNGLNVAGGCILLGTLLDKNDTITIYTK